MITIWKIIYFATFSLYFIEDKILKRNYFNWQVTTTSGGFSEEILLQNFLMVARENMNFFWHFSDVNTFIL